MRLSKLIIKNFRQLRNLEVDLKYTTDKDLHVFVGRNGSGKTNILNAINWCLYYDEPHLSKDSNKLPLLNLKTIEESWYNGTANCHVEFAYQYLDEQKIRTDKDPKDYLIYEKGWCDYSHFILINAGVNVHKSKRFTKEQEKTLFRLFELNKDDLKYYYDLLEK